MSTELIAASVAGVSLLLALLAYTQARRLQTTNERLRNDVRSLERRVTNNEEGLQHELARLNFQVKQQAGVLRFSPDLTIGQAFALDERARTVLASFHMGGCGRCVVDETQTLAEAATSKGRDLNDLLLALNTLPNDGGLPPKLERRKAALAAAAAQ